MLEEKFAVLPEYPAYKISNYGRFQNAYGRFLKPYDTGKGYLMVKLINKDGVAKQIHCHRLVAMAFLPNENNLPCVNHIDADPSNNFVKNLEWITYKANNQHRTVSKWFTFDTQLPPMDLTRWVTI